jgi:predicted transcriptional regulator
MAMTLRLSDDDAEALRAQAEKEGRSMQLVTQIAVREYIDRHRHITRVRESSARGATRYADALHRLGDA